MEPTPDIVNEAKKLKQNRSWALEQKHTTLILLSEYINKMTYHDMVLYAYIRAWITFDQRSFFQQMMINRDPPLVSVENETLECSALNGMSISYPSFQSSRIYAEEVGRQQEPQVNRYVQGNSVLQAQQVDARMNSEAQDLHKLKPNKIPAQRSRYEAPPQPESYSIDSFQKWEQCSSVVSSGMSTTFQDRLHAQGQSSNQNLSSRFALLLFCFKGRKNMKLGGQGQSERIGEVKIYEQAHCRNCGKANQRRPVFILPCSNTVQRF